MRFLCDMGVSSEVTEWLRGQGHDAIHLRDQGLQRLPNGRIFAKGVHENRVVITFDLDFGEIATLALHGITSVILFRLRNCRARHVISRLTVVLREAAAALEAGAIVVVEEGRIRIRELPRRRGPQ
jgi:predicted nuclease of predicted toxin-antitoxin system